MVDPGHLAIEQADGIIAALRAALAMRLAEALVEREARRREILDFLQREVGTSWECENCHYSTYHAFANECANCGTPFPLPNLLAFKLHATGTEDVELIAAVREELAAESEDIYAALRAKGTKHGE